MLRAAGFVAADEQATWFAFRPLRNLAVVSTSTIRPTQVAVTNVDGALWAIWSTAETMQADRLNVVEGLWRFAGERTHGVVAVRRLFSRIGHIRLCACGEPRGPGKNACQHCAVVPSRARVPAGMEPGRAVRVDLLVAWARRLRLTLALAAHLQLTQRRVPGQRLRSYDAPIPCLRREWKTAGDLANEARRGKRPLWEGDANTSSASHSEQTFQWFLLTQLVNGWLDATAPRLGMTMEWPAEDSPLRPRFKPGVGVLGNFDALTVAALQLASLAAGLAPEALCTYCGESAGLEKKGWSTRPHCNKAACKRAYNTDMRRDHRAGRGPRQASREKLRATTAVVEPSKEPSRRHAATLAERKNAKRRRRTDTD
jgi:hypothetical protein